MTRVLFQLLALNCVVLPSNRRRRAGRLDVEDTLVQLEMIVVHKLVHLCIHIVLVRRTTVEQTFLLARLQKLRVRETCKAHSYVPHTSAGRCAGFGCVANLCLLDTFAWSGRSRGRLRVGGGVMGGGDDSVRSTSSGYGAAVLRSVPAPPDTCRGEGALAMKSSISGSE